MKSLYTLLAILFSSILFAQQASIEKSPSLIDNPAPSLARDTFNLQFQFPTAAFVGEYGIESDGDYIYVTQWRDDSIARYDMNGNVVEIFKIPGVSEVRDLAWDGTYFYGSPNDYQFYVLDFTNKVLVNTCLTEMRIRGMAYDPDLDALWVSEHWSPSFFLLDKTDGTTLDSLSPSGITLDAISGLAYDNISPNGPYLWGFSQDSTGAIIVKYDIQNQAQTGNMIDVSGLAAGAAYAGGLFIEEITGLTGVSIGGMIQNDQIFGLELGYANALVGIPDIDLNNIQIYPNPVRNELHLNIPYEGKFHIVISDQLGKTVFNENMVNFSHSSHTMTTSFLEEGIYFIQVYNDTGLKFSKRFVRVAR